MQIPGALSSFFKPIACALCCVITIIYLLIKFFVFLTGTSFAGLLIVAAILYAIYRLLKKVGTFALYPGSVKYIQADYQIRGSQRIGNQIVRNMQQLFNFLTKCVQFPTTHHFHPIFFEQHVDEMIMMFQRYEISLSENKRHLLSIYRNLKSVLKFQIQLEDDYKFSYGQFLKNPMFIRQKLMKQKHNYSKFQELAKQMSIKISSIVKDLNNILIHYSIPTSLQSDFIKSFLYKVYEQKLYQISYGFVYWNPRFLYKTYLIQNRDKLFIQCAVIQGFKDKPLTQNKCVIFCCPNGAYIQYFALQSKYVTMYLELGYKIVLWNYRGYGKSTGSPTLSCSINDAQTVYEYCKSCINLKPLIVHGYSIGGPPAAYLAYNNQLKALVVDRSFCNFVNIAYEISPLLAKVAKFVMRSDSKVNISQIFLKIKNCTKVLIWSPVDEVISNGSSLKLGILNKLLKQIQSTEQIQSNSITSPTSLISESSLVEKELFVRKSLKQNSTLSSWVVKSWITRMTDFFQMVNCLYIYQAQRVAVDVHKNIKESRAQENEELINEVSAELIQSQKQQSSRRKEVTQGILKGFWSIVGNLDGGGTSIGFLQELAKSEEFKRQQQLHLEIKSFVLGLLYYGCCYHNGQLNIKNLDNWLHTIDILGKIDKLLSQFCQKEKDKCPRNLMQYFKQFQSILNQICGYLEKKPKNKQDNVGIVIPSGSGHNGELSVNETSYLLSILSKLDEGKNLFNSAIQQHQVETS